ncbi:MAG: ureidoglycolate lyase [Armatimonadetes bacterium]|nr:ureidoglycolate lyase [Armatimonadota bacterium]
MAKEVKAKQVTDEAFSKYGKLIWAEPKDKPFDENEMLKVWLPLVQHDPGEGRTYLLLTEKRRPMELTKMERHPDTLEVFTCVGGRAVAGFAPGTNDPSDEPPTDEIEAFLMDGVVAFTINKGQWHWPAFPAGGETCSQIVDFKTGTEDGGVDVHDLPETVKIVM